MKRRTIKLKSTSTPAKKTLTGNIAMDKAKAGGRNSNTPLKMGYGVKKTLTKITTKKTK